MNDTPPVYLVFAKMQRLPRFPGDWSKEQAVESVVRTATKQVYDDLVGYSQAPGKLMKTYPEWVESMAEQARWDWTLDHSAASYVIDKVAIERDKDAEMRKAFEEQHTNFIEWIS